MNKTSAYQKISKTSKQIFIAFISANGLKKNVYSDCVSKVVILEDLFN